jgi:hypothetical protein
LQTKTLSVAVVAVAVKVSQELFSTDPQKDAGILPGVYEALVFPQYPSNSQIGVGVEQLSFAGGEVAEQAGPPEQLLGVPPPQLVHAH